jgi:hypothetical protein
MIQLKELKIGMVLYWPILKLIKTLRYIYPVIMTFLYGAWEPLALYPSIINLKSLPRCENDWEERDYILYNIYKFNYLPIKLIIAIFSSK